MDKDKTVGEYMASIALECEETEEEFIFSHLVKFALMYIGKMGRLGYLKDF